MREICNKLWPNRLGKLRLSLILCLGLLCYPGLALAATLNVPGDYPTIQAGIDAADPGDVVLVDDGIYTENINFNGKAITVKSENGATNTTIDGNANGSVVTFNSGEGSGSVLDGFNITNGNGTVVGSYIYGGGIYCNNSSPTIISCIIQQNSVMEPLYGSGGGIYCSNSSPTLTNCNINSNTVSSNGGGIYCSNSSPTLTDCIINNNTAIIGSGGIYCSNSSPTLTNCNINSNITYGSGGGIHCANSSSVTITNCTINNNTANRGGGIYCWQSLPTITNCTISSNSVNLRGGGVYCNESSPIIFNCTISSNSATDGGGIACDQSSARITNCTIIGNSVNYYGGIDCEHSSPVITNCTITQNSDGGISCRFYSSPIITNCTISNNTKSAWGSGVFCDYSSLPTMVNTILWGNTPQEIYLNRDSSIDISYSNIQGGWGGTGNIDADPLFMGSGDYHLAASSPCIDRGTSTGGPSDDIDGNTRPYDVPSVPNNPTAYDMGSDEYIASVCPDADTDGYSDAVCGGNDCNDADPNTFPGAPELCDGVDNDCVGGVPVNEADGDGDGMRICAGDCDDTNSAIYSGAPELCDWVDNNCDGQVDEGCVACTINVPLEYPSIQSAIDNAHNGCLILVDDGIYNKIDFLGKAIIIRSVNGAASTIIRGGGNGDAVTIRSGVNSGSGLAGFTIMGGHRGISCLNSTPSITNCTISGNSREGLYCSSSSPSITNCTISNNSDSGVYCINSSPRVTDCTISGNSDGGIYCNSSSPTITNCTINNNSIYGSDGSGNSDGGNAYGGGIWCYGSSPTINNCIISSNRAYGGDAGEYGGDGGSAYGGGIYCNSNSLPTITNCIISNNRAYGGNGIYDTPYKSNGGSAYGGGIYCDSSSSPTISNCSISSNKAHAGGGNGGGHSYGGGIYYNSSTTITSCSITNNEAQGGSNIRGVGGHSYGGGIYSNSSPTISNCTISGNMASGGRGKYSSWTGGDGYGGGIYCDSSTNITSCTIINNKASGGNTGHGGDGYGGGICYFYSTSSPNITNCTISDNMAFGGNSVYNDSGGDGYGGGICCYGSSPTITNCTLSNNRALGGVSYNGSGNGYGGGIACSSSSSPTVVNSILWGNVDPNGANDIDLYDVGSSPSITYSDINPAYITGAGIPLLSDNINADPLFVDPSNADYHLTPGSPCINAGDPTSFPPDFPPYDIDGDVRPQGTRYDMGADEYVGDLYCYDISLTVGWNLMSLPLQPTDPAIESVLSSIAGKYASVWAFMDGNWKVYDPANPDFSDLLTMEAGWGYWINMNEAATLRVCGVAPPTSISLVSGWNLAGYNLSDPLPIEEALCSISGKYISVWAFIDGGWKVYDPANPDFSDLLTMYPGYGYWINATEDCLLTYEECPPNILF